jgi:hypothetical protein
MRGADGALAAVGQQNWKVESCALGSPWNRVRIGLAAGGGSLQRTRLWPPIPWLQGKIQGFLGDLAQRHRKRRQKPALDQCFTTEFPKPRNREVFGGLQGIRTGDQGNYQPYQGMGISEQFWMIIGALKCCFSLILAARSLLGPVRLPAPSAL